MRASVRAMSTSRRPAPDVANLSPLWNSVLGVDELAAEILAGGHAEHPGKDKADACTLIQEYCKGARCESEGFWRALAVKLEIPLAIPTERPTWLTRAFLKHDEYGANSNGWTDPEFSPREWVRGWCQMLCQYNITYYAIAGATSGIKQDDIIRIMQWVQQHAPHLKRPHINEDGTDANDSIYNKVIYYAVRVGNFEVLEWFLQRQQPKYRRDLVLRIRSGSNIMTRRREFEDTVERIHLVWWRSITEALREFYLPGALWVWENIYEPHIVPLNLNRLLGPRFDDVTLEWRFLRIVAVAATITSVFVRRPNPANPAITMEVEADRRVYMLQWLLNYKNDHVEGRAAIAIYAVPLVRSKQHPIQPWLKQNGFLR